MYSHVFRRFNRVPVESVFVWLGPIFSSTVGLAWVGTGYCEKSKRRVDFFGRLGTVSRPM